MSGVFLTSSAQNALAILNSVDRDIAKLEGIIASGKRIDTAADNAALWTVAETLRSQQASYNALSESLDAGKTTVSIARVAAESVVSMLEQVKTEITNASAVGANTASIQSTITGLTSQISSMVNSATIDGINLLQNNSSTAGSDTYSILSSYYTDPATGSATTQDITVTKTDLQTTAHTYGADAVTVGDYITTDTATAAVSGGQANIGILSPTVAYGASYQVTLAGNGSHNFASTNFQYVARQGDTSVEVATNLFNQINDHINGAGLTADVSVSLSGSQITITNNDTDGGDTIGVTLDAKTGGTAGGGLSDLNAIDVTTSSGRDSALVKIETLLSAARTAAASLGSAENRVEIQSDFLTGASAELGIGISALVDADLTTESARLAAAQAQRELALEALSIANDQRSSILALFQ